MGQLTQILTILSAVAVAAIALIGIGALASAAPAQAQLGQGNCVGMPPLASIPVSGDVPPVKDMTVDTSPAAEDPSRRAANLRWTRVEVATDAGAAGEPACIAIWLKIPGGNYESQTERILPIDATEFVHTPVGFAGEYCYRVAVLVGDARSDFRDSCFRLEQDQLPAGPDDSGMTPLPPTAGQGRESGPESGWDWPLLVAAGVLILAVALPGAAAWRRRA